MAKKQATKNSNLNTLNLQALAKAQATYVRTSAKNGAKADKCAYINATICKGVLHLQLQNAPLASKQLLQALNITLDGNASDSKRKRIDSAKAQLLLQDMGASAKLCIQNNAFFDCANIKRKQAKLQDSAKAKAKAKKPRKSAKASAKAKASKGAK